VSDPPTALGPPARLVAAAVASPFAPGREAAFVRVEGDTLRPLDVRDGDHVVLVRAEASDVVHGGAENGDLASVIEADGRSALWKIHPDGDRLRLSSGRPEMRLWAGPDARVDGVVVAVLRKFPMTARAAPARRAPAPKTEASRLDATASADDRTE
jgi:hypothetical protein